METTATSSLVKHIRVHSKIHTFALIEAFQKYSLEQGAQLRDYSSSYKTSRLFWTRESPCPSSS